MYIYICISHHIISITWHGHCSTQHHSTHAKNLMRRITCLVVLQILDAVLDLLVLWFIQTTSTPPLLGFGTYVVCLVFAFSYTLEHLASLAPSLDHFFCIHIPFLRPGGVYVCVCVIVCVFVCVCTRTRLYMWVRVFAHVCVSECVCV